MKTIETAISVNSDGTAIIQLQLSGSVPAGVHRAVVIVDEHAAEHTGEPLSLLPLAFEGWPQDCTFRREELYGDDER